MGMTTVPKEQLADHVGTQFAPGAWLTLDQDRIDTFAACTEDHQFIHVDQEKAAQTPFGGTIAHGFLTLSMLARLAAGEGVVPENVAMGINYGFDKVRFLAPVRAGKRVRAHRKLLRVDRKDEKRFLMKTEVSVEIEGEDTPALIAEWLTMVVCA